MSKNIFFLIILFIAIFLRVFRIDQLTTFGGDQGIDFLTVKDMIIQHKLTLIGIKTSIAPFFQGPLYLYMLLPFFILFHLQAIAGAVAAVVISIAGLILLYITMSKYFSKTAAILSSLLFAVSPQFIVYGNTPLYQHFLPLFIISSIYLFLYEKKNGLIFILLGLSAGLGMELHFLNIILALGLLIGLLITVKKQLQAVGFYLSGLVVGLSPTLLFELRHNFLNTHLFLSYQGAGHSLTPTDVFGQWVNGAAIFLGGNSPIVGFLILIFALITLFTAEIASNHYAHLRKLTLIVIGITLLLSLKFAAFEPHYALPVWILFLFILPIGGEKLFPSKSGLVIIVLLIAFNFFSSIMLLNNNHGYTMPSGWTLKKINAIGQIISLDSRTHPKFNVASLLDGNTRTYPVRYTTEINGGTPDAVENYPSDNYLYVVSYGDASRLFHVSTWEVVSLAPFQIGSTWALGDNIYLYRLDRIKSTHGL